MLYFYAGTDRERVKAEVQKAIARIEGAEVTRVTDAHSIADLESALRGGGMFTAKRVTVLQDAFAHDEMRAIVEKELARMSASDDLFIVVEAKTDAATRKLIQKHAEKSEVLDGKKSVEKRSDVFAMTHALARGDRKTLWVDYMRALSREEAPEAIHGVLFWGAKQMLLKRSDERAARLVGALAALPHEARRRGFELEYALEEFILNCV